jgi:hypothetical protein
MTNDILAKTVIGILRQPGIATIGYQLGGLLVTGAKLAMVARAIEEGKIECRDVTSFESQGDLAAGTVVEARYDVDANAILFPDANYGTKGGQQERTIVHEATHAMFDLYSPGKKTRTLAIDDEAAAVLVEAFYIRLCNKPKGAFTMMVDGPQDEALKLVDDVLLDRKSGTYFLKPNQTKALRDAVAKDWNFTKYIASDGLPTDDSRRKYGYNGVDRCTAKWLEQK